MFRWLTLAVLLSALGISAVFRRRARQTGETIARVQEGRALMAGRALVIGSHLRSIQAQGSTFAASRTRSQFSPRIFLTRSGP